MGEDKVALACRVAVQGGHANLGKCIVCFFIALYSAPGGSPIHIRYRHNYRGYAKNHEKGAWLHIIMCHFELTKNTLIHRLNAKS